MHDHCEGREEDTMGKIKNLIKFVQELLNPFEWVFIIEDNFFIFVRPP